MQPLVVGVVSVFAKVSVSPNAGGLPGTDQAEKVISGLMFWALLACVAGVIIGGAVWAVSSHGGNHHYAQRGKASFLISAVAAAVIAASSRASTGRTRFARRRGSTG